jgi:hypothetical protein
LARSRRRSERDQRQQHVEFIDHAHFGKAIAAAAKQDFEVIHLSCHGNDDGIALSDDTRLNWAEFATIFKTHQCRPLVLVMSTCCGAASGIGDAFRKLTHCPAIILGSTTPLSYADYCVAWAILYRQLPEDGVTRGAAKTAMRKINAVVANQFVYRRWDSKTRKYLYYPSKGRTYSVGCDEGNA